MPPKPDPYATPRARAADLILILLTLLAILFAVWTAPHAQSSSSGVGHRAISSEKR